MPLPSLRTSHKKDDPEAMVRNPETSFLAGEATPLEITDSTQVSRLPSQPLPRNGHKQPQQLPRPRSSWYSQPGISNSSSHFINYYGRPPSSPPPVPRLTSATLRSLEERFAASTHRRSDAQKHQYYGTSNPWQHQHDEIDDGDDDHSLTSSPNQTATPVRRVSVDAFLAASKYTPVSQYLRDRTWIPDSPSAMGYPPVEANGVSRRQSVRRSVSSLVDRTVRKGSTSSSGDSDRGYVRAVGSPENRKSVLTARPERRRSSVPALPHLLELEQQVADLMDSGIHYYRPILPRPQASPPSRVGNTGPENDRVSNSSNIGIPYEKTKVGRTPIAVTTLWTAESHRNRIPSQKPRPQVITRPMTPAASHFSKAPSSAARSSSSYQIRNNPLARMYARPPAFTQILRTRTRDPFECSEQGSHLFIGTLRGPTPAGLRKLHTTMDKAIAKHGEVEGAFKGCKEVRKWLRQEERGVIEWTLAYVRGRWGVEV